MFVYDSRAGALILYGGWYETPDGSYHRLSDTWAFFVGNHTWVQRAPRSSPSPRSDAAVAFDERNGITLLFGGFDGESYLGDMWYYVYANDTWISRDSPILPSPRADGRMVYDPEHDYFYLFSGNDYSDGYFNFHHPADMWRYNWLANAWAEIFPDTMPMPRDYAVFATNLAFGELLLVGGYGNRTILGDVWAFNTTQLVWRNVSTPEGPSPRMAAVGGYSPRENLLVVFGGGGAHSDIKTDTWFFRYPPPLTGRIFASASNPLVGEEVAFVGEILGGSGSIVDLSWDFGDGQVSQGRSVSHAFNFGMYRIRFVATDSRGDQISRTIDLDVGFLAPFWIDITLLVLGLAAAAIVSYALIKRRRNSRP